MDVARLPLFAVSAVAALGVGCVAREGPPPFPQGDGRDPDVRAIDEVGDTAPEAPITPGGAEEPADGFEAGPGDTAIPDGATDASDPSTEGYRTLGGVIGEVNGRAIYASDVLDARRNQLRAMALRLPEVQFERQAADLLMQELGERVRDNVLLSVFERNATSTERKLATLMTTAWRQQFISRHGGSEAEARRAAREQYGMSLEALGEDEYRRHLSAAFARKHVIPKVRPSAEDVREEYRRLADSGQLDIKGGIDFSLIEIRPDGAGEVAVAAAREEAADVKARAADGEAFEELAAAHNDNESLASRGGRLPASILPLARGSYAVPEVDAGAWGTDAGAVSEVIEVGEGSDVRFFVVRVNEKEEARTQTFSEVQRQIAEGMASREQQRLFDEYLQAELGRIEGPDQRQQGTMLRTAMEVVMQEYATWRAEADADASASR